MSELLAAIVESARKRFNLLVNNLMRPDVATLSKSLATDVAVVWSLSSMSSFMCLDEIR